jgi:phosphate transport system protein
VGSRHSSSQSINFVVNLVKLENIANLSSGSFKKAMSDRSKHISSSFDTALYGLKNDVLMMSSLTDRIFQTAIEALFNRDSELCDHVIAEDEEIDILEKQVDQDGVNLLIRFNPVASDMREVVSAMKVSANLERIADQSVTIARRAKQLNIRPVVREIPLLERSYRLAVAIYRDSLRAFADGDYELARTLKLKDRELDALTSAINEKLVERATADSELVPSYVDLIFIARALERIGDHATNIAEDSFWRDQAADIRHAYGPKKVD